MTFTPNWQILGYNNKEECVVHIIKFLKDYEKEILSHGLSGEATFQYGGMTLTLGEHDKKEGLHKKTKVSQSDR